MFCAPDYPLLLTPLVYALGMLAVRLSMADSWSVATLTTRVALVCAGVAIIATGPVGTHLPAEAPRAAAALVMLLIAFLGLIITGFARRYLRGEPGEKRTATAWLGTLSAVSAVVASTDLATLICAWIFSSIGLHHLLQFYPDRRSATIVAHKKFLSSRFAEVLLIVAAILLYTACGTLNLDKLSAEAAVHPPGYTVSIAATLIALAVTLKCAQLPLHGWLIQVMEAPTPVSALLHAGVVNLGGYVLLRLAPLIDTSMGAQCVLIGFGGATAVLAGLVMLTRITVKVRLAWSTCSQMGLMLMEIGLGLHGLALLHLLAHAVYKAYAFLTSGESVRSSKIDLMPSSEPHIITTVWISAAAVMSAGTVVAGSAGLWAKVAGFDPPAAVALILLCFGLSPRWWQPLQGRRGLRHALLMTIGAAQLYLAWHALLGLTGFHDQATVNPVTSAAAVLMIALVYAASALIALRRSAATVLYRWAYAGFYLDERITRLTFRLFPPLTQQESRLHTAATTEISP